MLKAAAQMNPRRAPHLERLRMSTTSNEPSRDRFSDVYPLAGLALLVGYVLWAAA